MSVCPKCGTGHEDSAKFCRKCGSPISKAPLATSPAQSTPPVPVLPWPGGIGAKRMEYDARLAAEPDDAGLWFEYALFLQSVNLQDDSMAALSQAVARDQNNPKYRRALLEAHKSAGDHSAVAEDARALATQNPEDMDALSELAEALLSLGKRGEAKAVLDGLLASRNNDPVTLRRQLEAWKRVGANAEVAKICGAILVVDKDDTKALDTLGASLWESGDREGAAHQYAILLGTDNENALAHLRIALLTHEKAQQGLGECANDLRGHLSSALRNAKQLQPAEQELARLLLCDLNMRTGVADTKMGATLLDIQPALLDDRYRPILRQGLVSAGDTETGLGNLEGAISLFEKAQSISPSREVAEKLGNVCRLCGERARATGKTDAARKYYEASLRHNPDQPQVLKELELMRRRGKRSRIMLSITVTVILAALGAGAVFVKLGKGSLEISVSPGADKISVFHGSENVVASGTGTLLATPEMRFGRIRVVAEKEGYGKVEKSFWGPFGNKANQVSLLLSEEYGRIIVNSEPPGALVKLKNAGQTLEGLTPCEIVDVLTIESDIEISLPECKPITMRKRVAANQTLDLGVVSFLGSLKVDSNPAGAEVWIGGQRKGETPVTIGGLPGRKTTIEIRKENVGVHVTEVEIVPGQTTDIGLITLSNLAALKVDSAPSGAKVFVDGKSVGVTPLAANNIEVGNRNIRVELPGYVPFEKTITVSSGQVTDLASIVFAGILKVDSEPSGAEVFIDGESGGVSPLTLEGVPAKDLRLELRVPGKGSLIRTVRVIPGDTTDLGVLKVRGFAGEWDGMVGSNRNNFSLYLKEDADGRLSGAGRMNNWDYWMLFEGKATGMDARITGTDIVACSRNSGSIRYYNLTFSMSMAEEGSTVTGKVSGGDNEDAFTLQRTDASEYGCMKNTAMEYYVQAGNSDGTGNIYCNGNLISIAPQGRKTAEINLMPWLKEGINIVRFSNTHSDNWTSSFLLKRGGIGADNVLLDVQDNGKGRGTYSKTVVIPYFENEADLQTWAEQHGTDKYLDWYKIEPVKTSASSQFGSDYPPENAWNGALDRGWITAAELTIGEWIEYEFAPGTMVSGFRLFTVAESNNRYATIKQATVECGGRTFSWNLRDTYLEQFLPIEKMPAERVRLRIDDINPGRSINAVVLPEFQAVVFSLPSGNNAPQPSPVINPDQSSEMSQEPSLTVNPAPDTPSAPSIPNPLSPGFAESPGRVLDTRTPTFEWTPVRNGLMLGLYVSREPYGEANIVFKRAGIKADQLSLTLPPDAALKPGTYRWNLESFDGAKSLGYSDRLYFRIAPSGESAAKSAPSAQELTYVGVIGKDLLVHVRLKREENNLSGVYYYEKYKTDIPLRGSVDAQGNVSMTEYDERENALGHFKGRLTQDNGMEGTWAKADGSRSLPFAFKPNDGRKQGATGEKADSGGKEVTPNNTDNQKKTETRNDEELLEKVKNGRMLFPLILSDYYPDESVLLEHSNSLLNKKGVSATGRNLTRRIVEVYSGKFTGKDREEFLVVVSWPEENGHKPLAVCSLWHRAGVNAQWQPDAWNLVDDTVKAVVDTDQDGLYEIIICTYSLGKGNNKEGGISLVSLNDK